MKQTLLSMVLCIVFLAGCNTLGAGIQGPGPGPGPADSRYHKKGPPPHAPAHGYRHKHRDGNTLVYEKQIGAYVVVNIPDTYFGNDLYIRLSTTGEWMVSATLDGGWRVAVGSEVPYKLRESRGGKHKHWKMKKKKHNKY